MKKFMEAVYKYPRETLARYIIGDDAWRDFNAFEVIPAGTLGYIDGYTRLGEDGRYTTGDTVEALITDDEIFDYFDDMPKDEQRDVLDQLEALA